MRIGLLFVVPFLPLFLCSEPKADEALTITTDEKDIKATPSNVVIKLKNCSNVTCNTGRLSKKTKVKGDYNITEMNNNQFADNLFGTNSQFADGDGDQEMQQLTQSLGRIISQMIQHQVKKQLGKTPEKETLWPTYVNKLNFILINTIKQTC